MKSTDTLLNEYAAALDKARQSQPPVVEDDNTPVVEEPEMTDEQFEAWLDAQPVTEPSETYKAACALLEGIKSEIPYFQQVAEENGFAFRDEQDEKEVNDKGLTTAINRSTSLVNVSDTMENIAALFARHPFGYKHGSRDSKGRVVREAFTEAENKAAEEWLASLKAQGKEVFE